VRSATASRSVDMEDARFCQPEHCCRLLQRHSTTREHDLERPILARVGGRVFPPAPTRCPRFPCKPSRACKAWVSPYLSRKGGRRATRHRRRLSRTRASLAGRGAPTFIASSPYRVRGGKRSPPTVAPRMVESMTMCVRGPTSDERRTIVPFAGLACDAGETVPSLVPAPSIPWSPVRPCAKGWRCLPQAAPTKIPV